MRKLYIIHSDKDDFDQFMSSVRQIGNTHHTDYDLLIEKRIGEYVGDNSLPYINTSAKQRLLDAIKPITEKYRDVFYKSLINWIDLWKSTRARVFVRILDAKVRTKVKRHYKRKNYVTVLLAKEKSTTTEKFDVVIRTNDKMLFRMELQSFVKKKLYSMEFIDKPRVIKQSKHV